MSTHVLISSAGRRVALLEAFRDTMASLGLSGQVVATDASSLSAASWAADEHFVVPRCTDEQFIPEMLTLCSQREIALLVPTIDTELMVLARHREAFREVGTLVAVSSAATIAIASDKRTTHGFLVERGFATVEQAEADDVLAGRVAWPYPLIVKPVSGSASEGVVCVHDRRALEMAVSSGETVVQTVAPGREFTVDLFIDGTGTCRGVVPRERLEVRAGEVVKARTARVTAVIEVAEQLAKSLPEAFGVLNLQLFHDARTDETRIIEINPRFGGGFPLAHRAGAPFLRWLLEIAAGRVPDYAAAPWCDDLVMLRYDAAVFVESSDLRD